MAAAAEMHPTLDLLPHSSSSSVCAACFTDWKGAYAYASQAVLALWWQVHCMHPLRCLCLQADSTWPACFLPADFSRPPVPLIRQENALAKTNNFGTLRPMFESHLCSHLRHRPSDLYGLSSMHQCISSGISPLTVFLKYVQIDFSTANVLNFCLILFGFCCKFFWILLWMFGFLSIFFFFLF